MVGVRDPRTRQLTVGLTPGFTLLLPNSSPPLSCKMFEQFLMITHRSIQFYLKEEQEIGATFRLPAQSPLPWLLSLSVGTFCSWRDGGTDGIAFLGGLLMG